MRAASLPTTTAPYEPLSSHQYSLRISNSLRILLVAVLILCDLAIGAWSISLAVQANTYTDTSSCHTSSLHQLFIAIAVIEFTSALMSTVTMILALLELLKTWSFSLGFFGKLVAWTRFVFGTVIFALLFATTSLLTVTPCRSAVPDLYTLGITMVAVMWSILGAQVIALGVGILLYVILVWSKGGISDLWKM